MPSKIYLILRSEPRERLEGRTMTRHMAPGRTGRSLGPYAIALPVPRWYAGAASAGGWLRHEGE